MFLQLFICFLIMVLAGFFSAIEMSVFSARRERMVQRMKSGDKRGTIVLSFLRAPTKLLVALQVATSVLGILLGTLVSQYFSKDMMIFLQQNLYTKPHSLVLASVIIVLVSSLFSIVISGAIPKKIAWIKADEMALSTARFARFWQIIMMPLVGFVTAISDFFVRLLRIKTPSIESVNEQDLVSFIESGIRTGGVDSDESQLAISALKLSDISVLEVLTHFGAIECLNVEEFNENLVESIKKMKHSYMLVKQNGVPFGTIRARDILSLPKEEWLISIQSIVVMNDSSTLLNALLQFQSNHIRMIAITNENGEFLGLITLHDVVAKILTKVPALSDSGFKIDAPRIEP